MWYHEGPPELLDARRYIAKESLLRARERLKDARMQLAHPDRARQARRTRQQNELRV